MILRLQENPFSAEDIHDKYLGRELKKVNLFFPTTNSISPKLKN
jgi:hypothetical protein